MILRIKCLLKQALMLLETYIVGDYHLAGFLLEDFNHLILL